MSTLMRDGGPAVWPNFQRGVCVIALCALSACASRMDGAPVIDRTSVAPGMATAAPTDQPPGPPPPGYYRVKPGDTLYRVALENGQNYRDIAGWNNLTNPNQIEVGQLLRVAPPGTTPDVAGAGAATTPLGGSEVQTMPLGGAAPPSPPSAYPSPYATGPAPASGASVYPSPYATPPNGASAPVGGYSPPGNYAAPGTTAMVPTPPLTPQPVPATPAAATGPISFIWPVRGQIVRRFDGNASKGIDIAGTAGTPVVAAAAGRVLYAGDSLRGYGNLIIIKHDNTFLTAYGHNRKLLVKENDVVSKGQTIAEMGDTQASRVMLHFEVRKDTKPVDPMAYLPSQ